MRQNAQAGGNAVCRELAMKPPIQHTPAADDASSAGEEDPGAALEELGAAGLVTKPANSCAAGSSAKPVPGAAEAPAMMPKATPK